MMVWSFQLSLLTIALALNVAGSLDCASLCLMMNAILSVWVFNSLKGITSSCFTGNWEEKKRNVLLPFWSGCVNMHGWKSVYVKDLIWDEGYYWCFDNLPEWDGTGDVSCKKRKAQVGVSVCMTMAVFGPVYCRLLTRPVGWLVMWSPSNMY